MSGRLFNGRVREIRSFPGAQLVAVSHAPNSEIRSHQHDWPHLGIHLAGGCIEQFEGMEASLDGPGAIYHPCLSGHQDQVLPEGLETMGLIFDPDWLPGLDLESGFDRPHVWRGGPAAVMVRRLLATWTSADSSEVRLRKATEHFFRTVSQAPPPPRPQWLAPISYMLARERAPTARSVAASLGLHTAWLARRYREATGEGLHETLRRKRVERALLKLRQSDMPLAEVAVDAGFCDQPHMNRCFRQVLGRTPNDYRSESCC